MIQFDKDAPVTSTGYEWRVTFGQQYPSEPNPRYDLAHRDGWVSIFAPDQDIARTVTIQWLRERWSMVYTEGQPGWPTEEVYPKGCLDVMVWDDLPFRNQSDRERVITRGIQNHVPFCTLTAPHEGVNGYVKVPRGHPFWGKDYDEIYELVEERIAVPGGITFSQEGSQEGSWWLGFDTGHAWDYWEDEHLVSLGQTRAWEFRQKYGTEIRLPDSRYWTPQAVREATRLVARQLVTEDDGSELVELMRGLRR